MHSSSTHVPSPPADDLRPRTAEPAGAPGSPADPGCPGVRVALSIVSNSGLLREGLAALLARHLDLHLVGCYAGSAPPAVDLPNPPGHVVLLDGSVGAAPAVAWTRHWRGRTPAAAVLVLELTDSPDLILACVEAGAAGYTLQGATAADVAAAIGQVRQGVAHCSPAVTARLFARLAAYATAAAPPVPPPALLTERERDVLRLVAADLSNQEIATALVIEVRTVKHHVHNILEKLQCHHRADAAREARAAGWLDPPA